MKLYGGDWVFYFAEEAELMLVNILSSSVLALSNEVAESIEEIELTFVKILSSRVQLVKWLSALFGDWVNAYEHLEFWVFYL